MQDPNSGGRRPPVGAPKTAPQTAPAGALSFTRVGPLGLLLALGVVALAIVLLQGVGQDTSPGAAPDGASQGATGTGPDSDQLTHRPQIEVLDAGELAAQYPELVRDELEKEIFDWFQQPGRELSDRRTDEEPEWVERFLSDDVRPRLARLPGWVFGAFGDTQRVLAEPGSSRGRLVVVRGAVRLTEETRLPTDPALPAWRTVVDDAEGRPWTILSLAPPPDDARQGNWVRANGAFVKLRPLEDGRPSFLVFTAQPVLASYPPVQVRAISAEWAAQVDDSTVEAAVRRITDEPPFWLLLNHVRTLGPEGVREKVRSGELTVTDMTDARGADPLAQRPASHRFSLVRLKLAMPGPTSDGAFVTEQSLGENPGNVERVFRGFPIDDQQRLIWVMSPFPAETFRIAGARLAIVEGFFYRRTVAETKTGKRYYMPVVIATSIEPVVLPSGPTGVARWAAWIALAGVAFCAVFFVILVVRRRRERDEAIRRHHERVAKRGGAQAGRGAAAE